MSTAIDRKTLLKKLNTVKPAVSAQSYIPILKHLKFDGKTVTAYNDIVAISVLCDSQGFEGCVSADLLLKTLSSMSAEEVVLQNSAESLLVSAGRSKIKLPVMPSEDFPFVPAAWRNSNKILGSFGVSKDMLTGIKLCLLGAGTDTQHPAQMGVTLDPLFSLECAALYSTDSVTLSRFTFGTDMEIPGDAPVIMPTFFCEQLLSMARVCEDVKIETYTGALLAVFSDGSMLFTKTLVDLKPMAFAEVFKKYVETDEVTTLTIPEAFEQSFERAVLVQSAEPQFSTSVSVVSKKMTLKSTSKSGEAEDVMSLSASDCAFYINPASVKRMLAVTSKIAMLPKVVLLTDDKQEFMHLVAHCSA
jgi:DNA polymerase III sliding clamp (beta) subunit (PCNA family)